MEVASGAPQVRLTVLGGFALIVGDTVVGVPVPVPHAGQRLLALLALAQRPVSRGRLTAQLWPDSDDRHASWSLRAALGRLPRPHGRRLYAVRDDHLLLCPSVRVDVHDQHRAALTLLGEGAADPDTGASSGGGSGSVAERLPVDLQQDVLPGWDEEWVVLARERHRQLRLHALESLAGQLTGQGRFGLALQCALAAVDAEPLRETAHRRVIDVHLAEGNVAEAVRQLRRCQRVLAEELRIAPSRALVELVSAARGRAAPPR